MKRSLLPVACVLCMAVLSCGKADPQDPEDDRPLNSACELSAFSIKSAPNPGVYGSYEGRIARIHGIDLVLLTVPDGTDLGHLRPTIKVSEGARTTIDGNAVQSEETSCDLSATAKLRVVSEDGAFSKEFLILAKTGNSKIDSKVYDIMVKYDIPGVSVSTTRREALAYSSGYGFSNLDATPRTRVRPDMLFRLASVSKAQTALCIMSLYEEGLLSPDDYVFAPEGAHGDGSPAGILAAMYPGEHGEGVDDIKVRHLLTHTSGWAYSTTGGVDPIFTTDSRFSGKDLKTRVEYMVKTATSTTPGSTMSYYNLGFSVLGQIVEVVSGQGYEDYLRSVAAKAGVEDIWVSKTKKEDRRPNECVYYPQGSNPTAYGNDMTVVGGCGAVIASSEALMRLLCAEDYGTVVPDILKPETLDMMYTNYTSSSPAGYGFGWRIGHNTLTNWASYHGGDLTGTATIWARGKNGVNGVLLCNSRSTKSGFDTDLYLALDAIMKEVG